MRLKAHTARRPRYGRLPYARAARLCARPLRGLCAYAGRNILPPLYVLTIVV